MTISHTTKRRMATTFAMAFMMFSIVVFPFWLRTPAAWPAFAGFLVLAPALLSLFPLILERSAAVRTRDAEARERWREQYRKSPQANLLDLHN